MPKFNRVLFIISILFIISNIQLISAQGVPDTPFIQEYHLPYPIVEKGLANDVRAIEVDQNDNVWVATKAGIYQLQKGTKRWISKMVKDDAGPAYDIDIEKNGTVWVGAWNGIYCTTPNGLERIKEIDHPISAICTTENEVIGLGPDGMWRFTKNKWEYEKIPYSKNIRKIVSDQNDGYWIATGMGLYHQTKNGFKLYQSESEMLSADVRVIEFNQNVTLWIGVLGGITIFKNSKKIGQIIPKDGLPSIDVQSVTRAPDGTMWIGTKLGAIKYDGKNWSLRHSKRWLLNDDVRDIAFDSDGTAWIATKNGVSAIKQREMTLAEKADYFYRICMTRHVREPGLVEKCRLTVPGDTTNWEPRDDDNDGQYTSMYLVMESFRYAVTKSQEAKVNAKKAFEGLRFLQTVTEIPGFFARTVIPGNWTRMADPNRIYTKQGWADERMHNPREKKVEKMWRLSSDGKWLWKGDTSSDETTGHTFGYLFYYDLVADKTEKKRVRDHICKIVDYIIDCGYVFNDIDGTHTQWAVWSPEKLNHDPDWRAEQGINSVEILSYLKLAYHVSGKKRYQKEYLKLLHEHNYAENVRTAKTFNPSWITHIDDELLALAYPCLLLHEKDQELQKLYRESLDRWYSGIEADNSPYFNFTYGAFTGSDPNLKKSIDWLRDVPLDLVRWRVDNSKRLDVQLVRSPEFESLQTNRMLPPSERALFRWDKNPWYAIQGDGGHTESDGVFWLLPYWMGRYYGFIDALKN